MSGKSRNPAHLIASREQIGEAAELRYHLPQGTIQSLLHSIVHSPDPQTQSKTAKYGPNPFSGKDNEHDPLAEVVLGLAHRLVTEIVPYKRKKVESVIIN